MTKDLVNIFKTQIGEDEVNSVDAYELWKKLGSKTPYNKWVDRRVVNNKEYKENLDWILLDTFV